MPVSTRSKITTQNDLNPSMQQQVRNPHHGLKEKLKTLTLLYEQQKQASKSLTAVRDRNSITTSTTNPNSSTVTKTFVLPQPPSSINDDAKENHNLIAGSDRIVGFTYPRKVSSTTTNSVPPSNLNSKNTNSAAVARRLSMPAAATVKGKEEELGKCVSRIMVFVRVRPMNKKEKELSSRCCVRIVNNRDVYLTESANENDYLRLNRVKGRHFTFDASFTDSATQEQVYSTTLVHYSLVLFLNLVLIND
jgi:kinesin family protein 18/19